MKQNYPIIVILFLCALVGAFTLTDYGESWDDHSLQKYADYSLRTYATWREQGVMPITSEDLGNYGPAYVMLVALLARSADARHVIYFVTYLAGVWAFYELGKRWLTQTANIIATLLFVTQPIFWGHAFMNPKDVPFMSFFLLSLLFGFRMIDALQADSAPQVDSRPKWILFALLTTLGLFAATPLIYSTLENLVRAAANGETNIISYLASDIHKAKPELYIQRYFVLFLWLRAFLFLLSTSLFIFANRQFTNYQLPIAALLLGFTTSIRIVAPFAGIIVALYALRTKGKQAIPVLTTYAVIAVIATYITYPYLWSDPVGHFIESLQTMSKYPWGGTVLFNGATYNPDNLPYSYLPVLLAVQLTEPVWILFFIGLFAVKKVTVTFEVTVTSLTVIWFILPLIGFIVARAALYDNFRQIFFILPPVFFMAGLGAEAILGFVNQPRVKVGIVALLILPALIANICLHPYQYVYYNSLVKNPTGKFELDYWAISYREAMEYVNAVAPANVNIMVVGPGQVADLYARDDLTVLSDDAPTDKPFDYVIVTTRYNFDREMYPDAKIIYKVQRDGMTLAVVKQIEK